jgi:pimeloyl-ACP methyl ester carboxylesterase
MPFFEGPKGPVAYQYYGSTDHPPLLLLNGIMMSMDSWAPFVKAIEKETPLLLVDFYDQGKSTILNEAYDQSLQVALIKGLLDHLNLKSIYLAGISYGASVAFQFATQFPEKTKSLLIFNGVMKTSPRLKTIGDTWNQVAEQKDGEAYYQTTIPMIYSDYFKHHNASWMKARKQLLVDVFSNQAFLDRMVRLTKSAENHDVTDQLSSLTMPVLVIASDDDPLTPKDEQVAIVNALKNADLVTFYQTGHASMYERPHLFLSTLLGFIKASQVTMTI